MPLSRNTLTPPRTPTPNRLSMAAAAAPPARPRRIRTSTDRGPVIRRRRSLSLRSAVEVPSCCPPPEYPTGTVPRRASGCPSMQPACPPCTTSAAGRTRPRAGRDSRSRNPTTTPTIRPVATRRPRGRYRIPRTGAAPTGPSTPTPRGSTTSDPPSATAAWAATP